MPKPAKILIGVFVGYVALIIALCFVMPDYKPNISFLLVGGVAILLVQILFFIKSKDKG